MIIFIDRDGSENVIRNDQIAIDLFRSGTITPDTMVKTDISSGEWKRAKDLELFTNLVVEEKNNQNNSSTNSINNEKNDVKDDKKEMTEENKKESFEQKDNNQLIDDNFYVPKGSSVPKVVNQNKTDINKLNIEKNISQTQSFNNYKIDNNIDIWSATSNCFSKYFDFQSRSRRSEYWYFYLFNLIVTIILVIIEISINPNDTLYLANIYGLITFIPSISCSVRRLHDVNRSGWWYFLVFTIIGIIPLLYWHCKDGEKNKNIYGHSPKYRINILL